MKNDDMNIYDIAAMAGVSIATVSRVVNGSDKVSEKTRKKVLAVIDKVGYTPNVFAQGLGLKTMHTVGIIVPTISDPYMAGAVFFLEKKIVEYGYDCILSCSGFEIEGKKKHVELLLSKHVDALILVGSTYAGRGVGKKETDYIREAASKIPVFIINGSVSGRGIYSAVCDDEEATYKATAELFKAGRKKVIFLTDSKSYSAIQKKKGFEKALAEQGIDDPTEYEHLVVNRFHAVKEYLSEIKYDYDGVIATNDEIGVGVIKYASSNGIRIPSKLSVIGYNNSPYSVACEPELTSIDNHSETICYDTVDRMIDVIEKGRKIRKEIIVPCDIVKRSTTDF